MPHQQPVICLTFWKCLTDRQHKSQKKYKIKSKDEAIAYYKDLKSRLSTKMVGESLEQHCMNEFNKIRATAFRNAYFEEDNAADIMLSTVKRQSPIE